MLFKKRAGILTLIFISVFLFAIFSFSKTAFSNPVIINGDFSSGGTGWSIGGGTEGTVSFDNGVADVESTVSSPDCVAIYQEIQTGNKNLAFKFDFMRTDLGTDDGSSIIVDFYLFLSNTLVGIAGCHYIPQTGGLPELNTWYRNNTLTLADVWADSWGAAYPMPDFDKVEIYFGVDYHGQAYFDNISAYIAPTHPPLSPRDWVLKDLSIDELLAYYGPTPEGFIKMLYDNILGRLYDDSGFDYWKEQLNTGVFTASQIAERFVFSYELGSKVEKMDNEEFITFLYRSLLSRTPDESGFKNWVDYMDSGASKLDTLRAFISNKEWHDICHMFNVAP
jgi:hypothetical protein